MPETTTAQDVNSDIIMSLTYSILRSGRRLSDTVIGRNIELEIDGPRVCLIHTMIASFWHTDHVAEPHT